MPDGTIGNDNLGGSTGNDIFYLYAGDDFAWGYEGDDWVSGGDGNDGFIGGAGSDTFWGGAGTDTAWYHTNTARVSVYLSHGWALSDGVYDYLHETENAVGSEHNDVLVGDGLSNMLVGRGGDDFIIGGYGHDTLFGGAGADRFDYNAAGEAYGDVIADFKWGEGDRIDLADIDAMAFYGGDQAFTWKGHTGAALREGELGFLMSADGNTAYVYGNIDGDSAYEISLTVSGSHLLQSYDFAL
jgi:serralysin